MTAFACTGCRSRRRRLVRRPAQHWRIESIGATFDEVLGNVRAEAVAERREPSIWVRNSQPQAGHDLILEHVPPARAAMCRAAWPKKPEDSRAWSMAGMVDGVNRMAACDAGARQDALFEARGDFDVFLDRVTGNYDSAR